MISLVLTILLFTTGHSLTCISRTCTRVYKVQPGEYLYLIAEKIGVPSATLQQCNPELTTTTLYVGQYICKTCSVQSIPCSCTKNVVTKSSDSWLSIANDQKMTIGYINDCNPSANIATTTSVPSGLNLCVQCRYSGRGFTISPYYEVVVSSLNANLGPLPSSGLKAASFAFVTGRFDGNFSIPSWENNQLSYYSSIVNQFSGVKTISFGGSQQEVELAIKLAVSNGSPARLANRYKNVIEAYGSNIILDFDIEGQDINNRKANDLRSKALKLLMAEFPGIKITYTLDVGASGLLIAARLMILNSISNGVIPYAVNIMTMNYGASNRGIDYDVKAIEQTYLQLVPINKNIKIGVIPMIGVDNSGSIRTVSDIDSLLRFATSKPYIYQFGYWAYHRDVPGTVGVSPCLSLAYCAGITGFSAGDYKKKFMSFSN